MTTETWNKSNVDIDELVDFYENTPAELLADSFVVNCYSKDDFEINGKRRSKPLYVLQFSKAGGHLGNLVATAKKGGKQTLLYHQYGGLYSAEELWHDATGKVQCPVSLFIDEVYDANGEEIDIYSGSFKPKF